LRCLLGVLAVQVVLFDPAGPAGGESPYYVDPAARITLADSPDNEGIGGLDGSMAVWYNSTTGMVYVRDLADPGSTARPIGTSGKPSKAKISGNHVVWYDSRNYHVYACDISQPSPTPVQLTSAPSTERMFPDISGNMVVWKDDRVTPGYSDIWGYDLSDPGRGDFLIVEGLKGGMEYSGRPFPAISGNWLVWYQESDDFELDPVLLHAIKALDLSGPSAVPLTLDSAAAVGIPRIDGTMVIYDRSEGHDWDMYGFDLADIAAGPFPISATNYGEGDGDISGNIAIYTSGAYPGMIVGVDVTDIAAGVFTFPSNAGDDYMAISGEWVLWREDMNVYANRIVPEPGTLAMLALGGLAVLRRRRRR